MARHDLNTYRALVGADRRQALALLGDAYRCADAGALQEGLYALALISLGSLLERLSDVDLDGLLEALLEGLTRGRDTEDAVRHRAQIDRRALARLLERECTAAQLTPSSARTAPILALPRALAQLPARYQQVAGLLALGYQGPDIAKALGIKEAAARKLIERVREELRVTLG